MTSAARAAQAHLRSVWSAFPIGTRVIVRNWLAPTETASEPWVNANGVAVIRVAVLVPVGGSIEVALSLVSLAGPTLLTQLPGLVEALPPPVSAPLGVADFLLSAIGLIGASLLVGWVLASLAVAITGWVAP